VCLGVYAGMVRLGDPDVFGVALRQVKRALRRRERTAVPH
jgi:hypothetical protein